MSIIDDETVWGGWSLGIENARLINEALDRRQPSYILEAGSGLSTILLGEYVQQHRNARAISLEHNENYFHRTANLLGDRGLRDRVDLRLVPLTPYPVINQMAQWYKLTDIPAGIEFALIDGPPGHQSTGRLAAVPALWNLLDPDFELWLDDSSRIRERYALRRWQRSYGVQFELFDVGRTQMAKVSK